MVCGLHDARRAPRVAPVLARLGSRDASSEPVAVARAMAMLLAGRPASQIAAVLEETLERASPEAENWDTRAALLWVLVAAERFRTVEESLRRDHISFDLMFDRLLMLEQLGLIPAPAATG